MKVVDKLDNRQLVLLQCFRKLIFLNGQVSQVFQCQARLDILAAKVPFFIFCQYRR